MFQRLWIFVVLVSCLVPVSGLMAEDKKSLEEEVGQVVNDTVNASKTFFSHLADSLSGEDEHPPLDSSQIITTKADLLRLLEVKVTRAEELQPGQWILTVVMRNYNDFSVKVTNMTNMGQVIVLDREGFAYSLPNAKEQGLDFIVLPRSANRIRFTFDGLEGRPATFRLLGTDFSIPR